MADETNLFNSDLPRSDISILIVDSSASFGQVLVGGFLEMGLDKEKIFYCKKYADALKVLETEKPLILLTEYMVDGKQGMELANLHAAINANKISIIITHNTSAAAVAEAAEELVDDYIVKPFSMGSLAARLKILIHRKFFPSDYVLAIRSGKELLKESKYSEALEKFLYAATLEKKPTLAYYYAGHSYFSQGDAEKAIGYFQKGLAIQPLHFRCLMGEFDAYFSQKDYERAYALAPVITENYPLSPKRLGNLFIAAIFTQHFQEIPKFYALYENLDHKSAEVRKVFSAAILTAGKYHLKEHNLQSAVECFDIGVNVVGADIKYLSKVIRELLKKQALGASAAASYLARFPSDEVGGKTYSSLSFLIDRYLRDRNQVIEAGKKLVNQGFADEEIFSVIVEMLVASGKFVLAEDMATKAIALFPGLRQSLYEAIEAKRPKSRQH